MKVLLCVTGSIASFKALEIGRSFKRKGVKVQPVLTKNALKFVTPVSFESLLQEKVYHDLFPDDYSQREPVHLKLTEDIDAILIAPATANIIGKLCWGIADDLVSTLLISRVKKIFVAPAMHSSLWLNPVVQENVSLLKSRGVVFIGPEKGELSDFQEGYGRLQDPEKIVNTVSEFLKNREFFATKKILLCFGRTEEPIDPVRVISNRSSGKMGIALWEEAIKLGAEVKVICAKTDFYIPESHSVQRVSTTREMLNAVKKELNTFKPNIFIMNAAVSDFKTEKRKNKIKSGKTLTIELKPNIDILSELKRIKRKNQIFVGFALESEDIEKNAEKKLKEKSLDIICANTPDVLGKDKTKLLILSKNRIEKLPNLPKSEASFRLYQFLCHNT